MLLTFSNDSLSPHYDPDDGPVIVSAAYRAEIRAFLLGEPEPPVVPPPVPIPHPDPCTVSRSDVYQYHDVPAVSPVPPAPTRTHRPPTSWYSIADGWHDCPPPKWPLILFDYSRPDEFDPNPVLADFVYHARDFADCPQKNFPAPDWVQIFLVDSDGNWSDRYVPINGLPPEHIALIDSARAAWNAQHTNPNSPSPLTERRLGGEVLPAERGSRGEVISSFLADLAPYLTDLLTARPHLLEALAALRAAHSERARRAAVTRRANRLFPVGTPFLASALWTSFAYPVSSAPPPAFTHSILPATPPTPPHPHRTRARIFSNPVFRWDNPVRLPPRWRFAQSPLRLVYSRARPPPRFTNVLAVPPGVFAFGTPLQLNNPAFPLSHVVGRSAGMVFRVRGEGQ